MNDLPLRLPLGEDALARVRSKANTSIAEFDAWQDTALSVAFDAPPLADS